MAYYIRKYIILPVCVVLMTSLFITILLRGTRWCSCLRHCAVSRNVAEFLTDIFLPAALWRWGWLRVYKKWVPYHLHVTTVLKSGNLNLLELSVPVQACNSDCFTFTFLMKSQITPHFFARREKARVSLLVCRNTEMARRSIAIRKSIAARCFGLSGPLFGVCQHLLA